MRSLAQYGHNLIHIAEYPTSHGKFGIITWNRKTKHAFVLFLRCAYNYESLNIVLTASYMRPVHHISLNTDFCIQIQLTVEHCHVVCLRTHTHTYTHTPCANVYHLTDRIATCRLLYRVVT